MLLVDTYNVLHTPAALRSLHDEPTPGHLAVLIAAGRYRKDRAALICDGSPHPEHLGPSADRRAELRYRVEGVEIVYAGPGRDADSLIERWIARDSAPRRLKIVSNDRRLIRAAKAVRARPVSADGFVETLLDDAERAGKRWVRPAFATEVPLSRAAVQYWHELFDLDLDDFPTDPAPAAPTPDPPPIPKTPKPKPASPKPSPPPPRTPDPIDPILAQALEEWRGRLSLDDLDMKQWLGDEPPSRDS
ncbi:MAG: NYN domain-containing protein [Planctomycetota bacterium]